MFRVSRPFVQVSHFFFFLLLPPRSEPRYWERSKRALPPAFQYRTRASIYIYITSILEQFISYCRLPSNGAIRLTINSCAGCKRKARIHTWLTNIWTTGGFVTSQPPDLPTVAGRASTTTPTHGELILLWLVRICC